MQITAELIKSGKFRGEYEQFKPGTKILDPWFPHTPQGKENLIEVNSVEDVHREMERYREAVGSEREWSFEQACQIMRVNPEWYVDERSVELVEIFLFHRPNAAQAFPGTFGEQPSVWIQAKVILDSILGSGIL